MKKIMLFILLLFIGFGYSVSAQSLPENTAKCASIYRDYEMLCQTVNRQHSPYPPAFNYHISAEMKNDYVMEITERQGKYIQNYKLPMQNIITIEKKADSVYHNALFILKMGENVLMETSNARNKTKYENLQEVSFTLENEYLIAETEALLNTICRDNHRRKLLEEEKKRETTY
jgi:hypothetical protein